MYIFEALSKTPEIGIPSVLWQDVCYCSQAAEHGSVYSLQQSVIRTECRLQKRVPLRVVRTGPRDTLPGRTGTIVAPATRSQLTDLYKNS